MARAWVRVVLVFAGLAAIAVAGVFTWSAESRARGADAALAQSEDAGRRALSDAAELRNAQQAYVAVGQGEAFWFARVDAIGKDVDDVLAIFKGHLASPEALAAADEAAAFTQNFHRIDGRARELVHTKQLAQASDVIFGDGFDVDQKLSAAITRGMTAERIARDAAVGEIRRQQSLALAGGAGTIAILLLMLIPGGRREPVDVPVSLAGARPQPMSRPAFNDLEDVGVVRRATVVTPAAPVAPAAPPPAAPPAPVPPAIDLQAIAAVCGDLARVSDTRAIPPLLERASQILDAAGIVLWIADPDGRELTPIVVHGYPPQLASRLGTLAREAANVTASAYRTGLLQTVKGDKISNGAIAAPLVSAGGCLGVMAAEMKNGGEQREPLLAAATIIASQISTLVGPPSARARAEAAG